MNNPPPYSTDQAYPPPQGSYPPPQGSYPPPQGAYPPPTGYQQTNVTVVQQPVAAVKFGENPVSNYKCPYCGNVVTTKLRYSVGNFALLIALIAFLFIGIFAVIFLLIDGLKDVQHICPVDGKVLGTYKRM